MDIYLLSLFPELFENYFEHGLIKKARETGLVNFHLINYRDFTDDTHRTTDDIPFGGGAGMVVKVEPAIKAFLSIPTEEVEKSLRIIPSARGHVFDQNWAQKLASHEVLIFFSGRYKGFDQRIADLMGAQELSLGDFVVQGGEIPILTMIDATVRLLPGFLGDEDSAATDSFAGGSNLLSAPDYTRPREFMGLSVPEVLVSGNHEKIARWKRRRALELTMERRPDLIPHAELEDNDLHVLEDLRQNALRHQAVDDDEDI